MTTISRRDFLRVSAAVSMSSIAAACVQVPATGAPEPAPQAQAATSAPPEATAVPAARQFHESPVFAKLVQEGKLPPIEERIPVNPCVHPVMESIGKYGGTIHRAFKGLSDRWGIERMQEDQQRLADFNADLSLRPSMSESWEVSSDGTTFTYHLRKGIRWSDGTPFTSEAFSWYYQHQLLNPILTPTVPTNWSTGSPKVLMQVETPDDYTVIFKFAHPNGLFTFTQRYHPHNCGHYMQQFHPDFVPVETLNKMAAEKGFANWDVLFVDQDAWYQNPAKPALTPWLASTPLSVELYEVTRNPYFWQVDPEGNQLPYVDKVTHRLFEQVDVFLLWVVGGEIDFQGRHAGVGNYTLFKENEKNGDYTVLLNNPGQDHLAISPNQTSRNPKLREFFGDKRVRLAMSYAVDRQEMNDLVYDGMAEPRQYTPIPKSPQFYPKASYAHIEFDPDKANALLDEAGFAAKDADGFRLTKDGSETLSFIIEGTWQAGSPEEDSVNLVIKHFGDVGIKCVYKYYERALYGEHYLANTNDCGWWGGNRAILPILAPVVWEGTNSYRPWCCTYGLWRSVPDNANAEKPPEGHYIWEIWRLLDACRMEPDDAKRNALWNQLMDIWVDEMPMPGYLGNFPAPVILKNGLRNFKEGYPLEEGSKDEQLQGPQQMYWDEPEKHA